MAWTFTNGSSIYLQIMNRIKQDIISGAIGPGSRIPSVRDLAVEAAVNPNTMQRALIELEQEGLIITQRNSGKFVTEDKEVIDGMKKKTAHILVKDFILEMTRIGITPEELIIMIKENADGKYS